MNTCLKKLSVFHLEMIILLIRCNNMKQRKNFKTKASILNKRLLRLMKVFSQKGFEAFDVQIIPGSPTYAISTNTVSLYACWLQSKLMVVFCDSLKFGSTAALDSHAGQNKGRDCKKELLLLPFLLFQPNDLNNLKKCKISKAEKETVNQTCPKSILQTIQLIINLQFQFLVTYIDLCTFFATANCVLISQDL